MSAEWAERLNDLDLQVLDEILEACRILKLDLTPSEFYEKYMIFPSGSALPGPARYSDSTPYWEEPVNCFAPGHPARDITIMGPAQMGKSAMILNAIIIYLISQAPCNILFLTGHSDLTARAMSKLDFALHQCGLDYLIGPTVKKKGGKTGDTAMEKEFRGGNLLAGSVTNHNMLRQNDCMVTIADDLDAGRMAKKDTGNTVDLIKGRTKAFDHKFKRGWVSTPQIKGQSLIEQQFEKSDKRYNNVLCQKCWAPIVLEFAIRIDDKESGGLKWRLDNLGRVDPKSVEYCCQKCAQHFSDRSKYELLKSGVWIPTCEPMEQHHYGYGINGLYAPHGMTSWFTLVEKYLIACPTGQARNEERYQTWKNVDMGELYEQPGSSIKAGALQLNVMDYSAGTVPDILSQKQGNGKPVLITCAVDLGGWMKGDQRDSPYDDVRADWQLVVHTESGSTYDLAHGSIGTFTPAFMGKKDEARERWSYDMSKSSNVWKVLDEILEKKYPMQSGGTMGVHLTVIDTGFQEHHVFNYIDRRQGRFNVIGVKGNKEHKYIPFGDTSPNFHIGATNPNLYILKVGKIKDIVAQRFSLFWDRNSGEPQPPGFMNFPKFVENGMYGYENFFLHMESEERKMDKDNNFIWQKKTSNAQNHHFDTVTYNTVARDICMRKLFDALKMNWKEATWQDFCKVMLG